jgi:hypothetical protein
MLYSKVLHIFNGNPRYSFFQVLFKELWVLPLQALLLASMGPNLLQAVWLVKMTLQFDITVDLLTTNRE